MTGNEKIKHFRIQPELFVLHKESFFPGKESYSNLAQAMGQGTRQLELLDVLPHILVVWGWGLRNFSVGYSKKSPLKNGDLITGLWAASPM